MDLKARKFDYDTIDYQTAEFLTPDRKDTLLRLLGESYLALDSIGLFQMNDYAFFVPEMTDTSWDRVRGGKWNMNEADSILQLRHPNGTLKCFKVLSLKEDEMIISELYECKGPTMIEVRLHR